jgi:hypothetical protein
MHMPLVFLALDPDADAAVGLRCSMLGIHTVLAGDQLLPAAAANHGLPPPTN